MNVMTYSRMDVSTLLVLVGHICFPFEVRGQLLQSHNTALHCAVRSEGKQTGAWPPSNL